jgi:hypothetical protein
VIPNLNLLASLIQQQRGAPGQPLVQPGMQPMEQGLLDEEEQGFPDMRAEDPDFLRYQMMPLDEQQAQLQRQMQAADALMQGSRQQHTTPLGAAIGGLADVVRMGVGGYRMGGLQQKMDALGQQRTGLIEQAGKGPSTLRRAMQKAPADTSIREGYLNLAREREERLKEQAGELEGYRKELTALKKTGAAAAATRRAQVEDEKKTQGGIKLEGNIRREVEGSPIYKAFQESSVSRDKVRSSFAADSAAGDIAGIYAVMKTWDPGSTVREGEFATAQNAGGVPERLLNIYNKTLEGTRLTPQQRQDFIKQADLAHKAQEKAYRAFVEEKRALAKSYGVNPERVAAPPSMSLDEPPPAPMPTTKNLKSKVTVGGKVYRTYADGTVTIEDE